MTSFVFVVDTTDFEDSYGVSDEGHVITYRTGHMKKPTLDSHGYLTVKLWKDNKQTKKYIHRLIAQAYIPNPDNLSVVDHIDRNRLNNSISNLRWCSHKDNSRNKSKCSTRKSSRFNGVYWHKAVGKWASAVHVDDKRYHLGLFHDEEEAARKYNEAALKYFGKFANLNQV